MTHSQHIDPLLAAQKCTPAEQEIVRLRNYDPPMSWTNICEISGKRRGTVRQLWASANQKVNGGYVPPPPDADTERAKRALDPDVLKTWQGIPMAGTRGAIQGTHPERITRSGK